MAVRFVRDDGRLASVRAAYAALILGLGGGLALAAGTLSDPAGGTATATVAGALAVDGPPERLDRRRAEAVAVLVAGCMAERGVPWKPWVEPPPPIPDAHLDPLAWAARWGFGVSTLADRQPVAASADPNLAAGISAPPDVRDDVRGALFGDRRGPGCQTRATDEVYGLRDALLVPLREKLRELDDQVGRDPKASGAMDAWRTCVAPIAEGLPLDRRTLANQSIARFVSRLDGVTAGPGRVAAVAALQLDERRQALILARCDARHDAERASIAAPYEAAFVARYRAELERIGAAIRAAEAALPTLGPR